MNNLDTVLAFANSRKVKKPSGSRVRTYADPLADAKSAAVFLENVLRPVAAGVPAIWQPVNDMVLMEIRDLREAVEEVVETLVAGNDKGCKPSDTLPGLSGPIMVLNGISSKGQWIKALGPDLGLAEIPVQSDPAGLAAAICVEELAGCDPTRIKKCQRPQCGHFFYDTTRNRSAKWHSENPCGWRIRSGRRRKGAEGSG